ncbi:MAG: 3-ketoacyl-ACP reductase [Caulobacteraceae bacterium]|nr:3-ketoacyl-ACP reductase [Caulobacteraceae bacterium]
MDLHLKGKRALVTGGTRGIGRAIIDLLSSEGADVAFCGRGQQAVDETLSSLAGKPVRAIGAAIDVTDGEALRAWVTSAAQALGGLDIVVPNVSAGGGGRTSIQAWRENFEVDMLGTVHTVEAALPFLEASGGGSIVIISSTAAVEAFRVPQPYNAMKAALINYTKNISNMLALKNIRANSVSPGPVYAENGGWASIRTSNPDVYDNALSQIPLGRMGSPQEIASAVAYLASPIAGYTTGANLIVDGGFTKRVNF